METMTYLFIGASLIAAIASTIAAYVMITEYKRRRILHDFFVRTEERLTEIQLLWALQKQRRESQ